MKLFVLLSLLFLSVACREADNTPVDNTTTPPATGTTPTLRSQTLLTGYEIIWGMDFLPNGDMLFTEKRGRIYRFSNGTATQLTGLPNDIDARGQGGLLDVRVHPNYASTGWVYAAYSSTPSGSQGARLNLVRFKLNGNAITSTETIFQTPATNTWRGHYGGRIAFDRNGLLYLSIGEGGSGSYGGATAPNQNSQNLQNPWGKIHRLTDAGGIAAGNPVLPGTTAPGTIFSYGHRNPQGLAFDPATGQLWATEHGPRGGDEINLVQAGRNYGWPLVSNGVNYDGTPVSASPTREGIEAPLYAWTPSIGTCGLAFITSEQFGTWRGSLLTGALALTHLSRAEISNNRVTNVSRLLDGQGRFRNVIQGPDGAIYVSVEGPGRILRLTAE
ncbi:PQQ-dependent sugar dehydrogenase [Spirosoma montaniterrae]|uniref:Glucose/Sorbosone dehydrogenase domain-containing protein n=1 Tax=Spirosoma montaniterrae TaxID=1178516 RepID=A0A1P9WW34_9BACT|nr:PQQ-dependent sugar dehydrogenase [Spirosoma montaniterrae]AQG79586.1 hypothetical protein AWR27_09770 [Spirosoma montaniterrae]